MPSVEQNFVWNVLCGLREEIAVLFQATDLYNYTFSFQEIEKEKSRERSAK